LDLETFSELSPRETQLLLLSADGHTDNAIAQKLGISVATVNSYWVRVRSKLGAQSRTEAVAMALRSQAEESFRKLQAENERLAEELSSAAPAGSPEVDSAGFRELLQAAPDGILIVGRTGKILACNPVLAQMFGYGPTELVGQLIAKLVPERLRTQHIEYVQGYFGSPSKRRMGHGLFTPGLRKDGSEFVISVTLGAHETTAGKFTVCMVRDATPELQALAKHAPDLPELAEFKDLV